MMTPQRVGETLRSKVVVVGVHGLCWKLGISRGSENNFADTVGWSTRHLKVGSPVIL